MFIIVATINVVPNAINAMNLLWFPSNFHIHLHQIADVFHLSKPLHHVFKLSASTPSIVSLVEMLFMVFLKSI